MAKIIAYEGADRVGKATQSKMMTQALIDKGFRAVRIEVPVKNFLHPKIYSMLKSGYAAKHPYFFQAVQVSNRRVFQLTELPSILDENDYVVFDRWSPSTWVYGLATGLPRWYVDFLLLGIKQPDHVIILDGSPHVAEMRDVYEKDFDLQERVRNLYRVFSEENSGKTDLIKANQERDVVFDLSFTALNRAGIV